MYQEFHSGQLFYSYDKIFEIKIQMAQTTERAKHPLEIVAD